MASGIWLYADLTSGPNGTPQTKTREFLDIPIEYLYESALTDRGLMLVENGTDRTIDLTLEGTRWDICSLDRSKIRVTASLFDITSAGEQRVNWNISFTDSKFSPSNIGTEDASIRMATVNISELYSRTIDVSCELVGGVADTYSAGQVELSHAEVEVRGLQEDINPISYAKVTLDIGANAVETVSRDLELQYYDENGRILDKSGIYSSLETVRATLPHHCGADSGLPAGVRHQGAEPVRELYRRPRMPRAEHRILYRAGDHCRFRRRHGAERRGDAGAGQI